MTNNDCLRRVRYILDLSDSQMINIFANADHAVTRQQVSAWLKREDDPAVEDCPDSLFVGFLNGLIVDRRGKKESAGTSASSPTPQESRLNNNMVFMKLKIAFNLKAEEILVLLRSAELVISKHELSAFFRRPDHKHYRVCKDQILRKFLQGLQLKYRGEPQQGEEAPFSWDEARPAKP